MYYQDSRSNENMNFSYYAIVEWTTGVFLCARGKYSVEHLMVPWWYHHDMVDFLRFKFSYNQVVLCVSVYTLMLNLLQTGSISTVCTVCLSGVWSKQFLSTNSIQFIFITQTTRIDPYKDVEKIHHRRLS